MHSIRDYATVAMTEQMMVENHLMAPQLFYNHIKVFYFNPNVHCF